MKTVSSSPPNQSQLVRGLGLGSATSVVAGAVIGSGVFLVASEITKMVPGPFWALAVWVIGAMISMTGGLMVAELGAAFPGAGGPYVYLREGLSPLMGFLNGWNIALIAQPGAIAGSAIAFAHFAAYFFPMAPLEIKLAASGIILVFTAINWYGVKAGARVQDVLTVIKVTALIGIGIAGLFLPAHSPTALTSLAGFTASGFGVALIAVFWAYEGWINVSYVAGEVTNPRKNVPFALFLGIGGCAILYLLTNVAYYRFLPIETIANSVFPAAEAARIMGGEWAVRAIHIAVILSTLGCISSLVLAGPRVSYAMAKDGVLPKALAYVHPIHRIPTKALLVQTFITLLLIWSGSYIQLVTYVISANFIFYGLLPVALIALRRKQPTLERPYKVPFYPVLPGIFILFTVAFLCNAVWEKPWEALTGFGIVLLGVPVYYLMKKEPTSTPSTAP